MMRHCREWFIDSSLSRPPRWYPWDIFRSFKVCSDDREWDAESNGNLPHIFIPNETATLAPEFAVEDLRLDRTADFGPEFAVKNLFLSRTL